MANGVPAACFFQNERRRWSRDGAPATSRAPAARRGGAEIFLVPDDEAETAEQEAAGRLRV